MSLDAVTSRGLAVPTTGLGAPVEGSDGHIRRASFESDILRDTDGDSAYSYNPAGGTTNGPAFVRYDPEQSARWDVDQIQVDIIGIPAVGADPIGTWTADPQDTDAAEQSTEDYRNAGDAPELVLPAGPVETGAGKPSTRSSPNIWIIHDIRTSIPNARVILYDHGEPEEGVTLKRLAEAFLGCLHKLRETEKKKRPLFLVCHSTGGLVAKLALTMADRRGGGGKSLVADCFGISFFGLDINLVVWLDTDANKPAATPHKGSSYLSSPAFTTSIREAMHLKRTLPKSLRRQFEVNSSLLQSTSSNFRLLAGDMKVWTFYETQDTDLTRGTKDIRFLAPITSIKSAILDMYHEMDYPLLTDHVGCASFSGRDTQTKLDYLTGLKDAVEKAHALSGIKHNELRLREKVKVEIHGFYEGTPQPPDAKPPIRLCSTRRTLQDFMDHGPSKCLADRLRELPGNPRTLGKPRPNQYLHGKGPSLPTQGSGRPAALIETARGFSPNKPGDPLIQRALTVLPPTRSRSRNRFRKRGSQSGSVGGPPQPRAESATERVSKEAIPDVVVRGPDDEAQNPESSRGRQLDYFSTVPTAMTPSLTSTHGPNGDVLLDPAGGVEQISGTRAQSLLSPPLGVSRTAQGVSERASEQAGGHVATSELPTLQFTGRRKLTWIHTPFNNPPWVSDVLEIIAVDRGDPPYERLLDHQNWASKHVRIRQAEHHACFVKPGCQLVSLKSCLQISLCLPYLHWDTYKLLVKRRYLLKKRMSRGRCRPVPEEVSSMDLEHRVTWAFLGHDPPFNCRRTLDQFGYPSLHDTRARDDDQMLYKMTKKRRRLRGYSQSTPQENVETDDEASDDEPQVRSQMKTDRGGDDLGEDLLDGTVLMVDQLWMWILSDGDRLMVEQRQSRPTEGRLYRQADLYSSIYNEVNGDLGRRCENSLELAALVALHAVTVLFEHSSHSDLEVFRIFEESISILTEKMTRSFKDFRLQGFRDKRIDYDSDSHEIGVKERHKIEAKLSEKQNRDDTSAMLELRDIDDELNTLAKLFREQIETITQIKDIYDNPSFPHLSGNGLSILNEALEKLKEYTEQVKKMLKSANRARKDFEKLLNLKQRQANVDEARLARYHADLASMQSRAVMIFTVFSVIFLPLTFFTGLFGMNVSEWSGSKANPSWRTVVKLAIPLSFATILFALVIALSTTIRKSPARLAEGTRRLVRRIGFRGSARKEEDEDSDDADFWESHVDRRENAYEIPRYNVSGVEGGVGRARRGKDGKGEKGRGRG
ncbi:MAG: hypothetical protein M1840_005187 [Geoglossum simile]|nr:MAG: hypothetical protein M1840_005187 [Geoglossum simile]